MYEGYSQNRRRKRIAIYRLNIEMERMRNKEERQ